MLRYPALATLLLLTLSPSLIQAQQMPNQSKSRELSVFAGFSVVRPDIFNSTNTGVSAGAAYTFFFRKLPVDPSIALRGTYASGKSITERTVNIGLQLSRRYGHFHPYADFLIGGGTIVFAVVPPGGDHIDKGLAYTYGGGVDYDLTHSFRLRLDAQLQNMNFGPNYTYKRQGGDFTLSPLLVTLGINYVIPFRPHIRYTDTN
ncbi:MAG: hypothetical protein ABI142_01635 [Bryocella sp.]